MRWWLIRLGVLACVVLVLVAGLLVGQHTGLICFSEGPGDAPTMTTGPVTIGTDHSVYATSDTITVTITNHLDQPILLVSQLGHCQQVVLANISGNGGRGLLMNPCHDSEAAPTINTSKLLAGDSEIDTLSSSNLDTPLTDGTYEVSVRYLAPPPTGPLTVGQLNAIAGVRSTGTTSPTFRVCTCRIC